MPQFTIERGDDELVITFKLSYDRTEREWYPETAYHEEVEIDLTPEEWVKLIDHFKAYEDYYLYHNDESTI